MGPLQSISVPAAVDYDAGAEAAPSSVPNAGGATSRLGTPYSLQKEKERSSEPSETSLLNACKALTPHSPSPQNPQPNPLSTLCYTNTQSLQPADCSLQPTFQARRSILRFRRDALEMFFHRVFLGRELLNEAGVSSRTERDREGWEGGRTGPFWGCPSEL